LASSSTPFHECRTYYLKSGITITLSAASTLFKDSDSPEIVLERLHTSLNNGKKFGPNQITWK
jgi:hypothetical protein